MSTFSRALKDAHEDYRHETEFAALMHRKSVIYRERGLHTLAASYQRITREAYIHAAFARDIIVRLTKA